MNQYTNWRKEGHQHKCVTTNMSQKFYMDYNYWERCECRARTHSFIYSIQLYKLFNSTSMTEDCLSLNFQQNYNGRNDTFQVFNISIYKVGLNLMVNRFKPQNNKIDYLWFNESFNCFKIKCKHLFLQ